MEKREIESKATEIQSRRAPLVEKRRQYLSLIEEEERKLRNLDSQLGRQEAKLQAASQDSLKAYRWILDNQDRFEKEVFGPPTVTCSITDPKYADAIESLFQRTDFLAFTTQSKNDFRTLQRALMGELKLQDISIRTCSTSLDLMRPPLSADELRRLGFDGWAKDFLKGPEPVVAMLCSENRLHQTPVGLREISDESYSTMESGNFSSWVSGKHSYLVTRRREYGPGATSTRVRQVKPAKVWTSQPVDASFKQQHRDNILKWTEQQAELEEQMNGERAAIDELREQLERVNQATVPSTYPRSPLVAILISNRRVISKMRSLINRLHTRSTEPFLRNLVGSCSHQRCFVSLLFCLTPIYSPARDQKGKHSEAFSRRARTCGYYSQQARRALYTEGRGHD